MTTTFLEQLKLASGITAGVGWLTEKLADYSSDEVRCQLDHLGDTDVRAMLGALSDANTHLEAALDELARDRGLTMTNAELTELALAMALGTDDDD